MQRLTIVRYTVKPGMAEENIRLSQAVFDEVRANAPEEIAYALCREGDAFVHVFLNRAEDHSDAVTALPSFDRFQEHISARCAVPPDPVRQSVVLVDSYGFGGA